MTNPAPAASASTALVASGAAQTADAASLLDASSQAILAVTLPSSPVLPNLAAHLASAQAHAQQWLGQLHPAVNQVVAAASTVANTFLQTTYAQLRAQLAAPNAGGGGAAPWQATLQALVQQVGGLQSTTAQTKGQIDGFRAAVAGDCQNFSGDASLAQTQIKTDQSTIATLSAQISKLNDKIAKDHKYEDVGWVLGPAGYLIARELGDLIANVQGMQNQIAKMQAQYKGDQLEVASLSALVGQLGNLVTGVSNLMVGLTSLANGWQVLAGELSNLAGNTNLQPGPFAAAQVDDLRDDFQDILNAVAQT